MLLFAVARAGEAVKSSLYGHENGRKQRSLAVEDARHVAAERLDEQKDDPAEKQDLKPSVEGHGHNFQYLALLGQKRSGRMRA